MYNHFADKDGLLLALCNPDFQSLRDSFGHIGRIADPIKRLRRLGGAYIDFAVEHLSRYRVMFMTPRLPLAKDPMSTGEKESPDQDAFAFQRTTVEEGLDAGLFREEYENADLLVQVIWSGVHGVASLHIMLGKVTWYPWRPINAVGREMVEAMIRGIVRCLNLVGGDRRGRRQSRRLVALNSA